MLELSNSTNLLEQKTYKYSLQDIAEPNLYRELYSYDDIPKISFNHRRVPMGMPKDIWITDTSLCDGQQSVEPYTVKQIVDLYKLMSKLGGPYGIIRQTEFFVYSKKDREAVAKCQELGLKFPEITTWIRANKEDFKLVKDLGIKETGILVSCSDYHIFKKLKMTRKQAMDTYLSAVANASTAWLYGASAVNCSLLGIGERTGNIPLEAMIMEYASLRGSLDGMDTCVITEIADYFKNEIGYEIPLMTPFVGKNFNVTRAGIHADGLLKDEEIYNIFNTGKILNRPVSVLLGKASGLAGIAYWINQNYNLSGDKAVDKKSALVVSLKEWIDKEYEDGRQTTLATEELEEKIKELSGGSLVRL